MTPFLAPYIEKVRKLLRTKNTSVESPAIVEPVRDWKYLLLGSAALIVVLCTWALYMGLAVPTPQEGPVTRPARLDREALLQMLSIFEERAEAHDAARIGGRAFVDPGR